MKARIFTLHFDRQSRMIDDRTLREFLDGRRLVSMTDHMLMHEGEPMLVVSITYCDDSVPMPRVQPIAVRQNPANELDAVARGRFEALRRWRNEKAEAVGRPKFALLTNRQLMDVANMRPVSLTELRTIQGIGDARVASHGREILELLTGLELSSGQDLAPSLSTGQERKVDNE